MVVPVAGGLGEYRETKEHIEEAVGNINGKYGDYRLGAGPIPVHIAPVSSRWSPCITPARWRWLRLCEMA